MSAETFSELMTALRAFRKDYLREAPSNRAIARALGMSPQTVTNWLTGTHFPDQDAEAPVKMVRMIKATAEEKGIAAPGGLLDEDLWREAHRAEATRRRGRSSDATVRTRAQRAAAPGMFLDEATDPFQFEVHPPVEADGPHPGLPTLPPYVRRAHDEKLAAVARAACNGQSGIAVLVGGSSTGKTRACWEMLKTLTAADLPNGSWRLWHPLWPFPAEAASQDLPLVASRTVIWLNEAQRYLAPSGGSGEKLAAGLRELLRDPPRGPVLILATLWPEFWDKLTTRPMPSDPDPHAQARELLTGRDITVASAFTEQQLRELTEASDPRLLQAARSASEGEVIQYLAGAPGLLSRYENAPAPAKALIHAAMDVRRLGMGVPIPQDFLEQATPAYLTDREWNSLPGDWLSEALEYVRRPCKGVLGPLYPSRSRPHEGNGIGTSPAYRLADYLDQHSRRTRHAVIPQSDFWAACEAMTDPGELRELGCAAQRRGLLLQAARMWIRAARGGDTKAAADLIRELRGIFPDVQNPQWQVAEHVAFGDPWTVAELMHQLQQAGAWQQLKVLVGRDPAAHVRIDNLEGVIHLLGMLRRVGAYKQATALADRMAVETVFDNPFQVARLFSELRSAGLHDQLVLLARGPASNVILDNPQYAPDVIAALWMAGAQDQAITLADRITEHLAVPDPLRDRLIYIGWQWEQVAVLLLRDIITYNPEVERGAAKCLSDALRSAGVSEEVCALAADESPVHNSLDNAARVAVLVYPARTESDAYGPFMRIVRTRNLPSADFGSQEEGPSPLEPSFAEHASFDDARNASAWLDALVVDRAQEQIAVLLALDRTGEALTDDPPTGGPLLNALYETAVQEHVRTLTRSAEGQVRSRLGHLLEALRRFGAADQSAALMNRLPAEGRFDLFIMEANDPHAYRFGRHRDGTPAAPWSWEDLD